jgi:hypothetical protein
MYGKKHSEKSKEKISKATSGKNNPMYGKPGVSIGKKWINNGKNQTYINKNSKVPEGWKLGMIKQTKTK